MKKGRILSTGIAALMASSILPFTSFAYEKGDVNRDGLIDARDASAVLQEYARLSTGGASSMSLDDGDYNGDGQINAADASAILIKYAELSTGGLKKASVCISDGYSASKDADRSPQSAEFAIAQTDFAVKLMQNTMKDENIMLSPYSVMEALAMTANGADGNTLEQMEQVLGGDISSLNGSLATRREVLNKTAEFSSANSVWFKDSPYFAPKNDFLQFNADYYGAELYKAPFDESTVDDINGWANDKTKGLIPQFIKEIDDSVVMYLINAAVFEGEWETAYPEYAVRPDKFTAADGTEQEAEMMHSTEKLYIGDENACGLMKSYSGGKYAFAAIVPNKGVDLGDYLDSLNGEKLHKLLSETVEARVYASIPKFKCEYDKTLNNALKSMGMTEAFSESADFSKMSNIDIMIDKVQHKTFIEVNEKGTKAAAVTGVTTEPTSVSPEYNRYVYLDRPFLYCIVDTETYIPVFIGALQSIEQAE